jgi:isoamylase
MSIATRPGSPFPLGARCDAGGINFALYAPDAQALALRLYDAPDAVAPLARFELHARQHRSGDYWHVYLEGVAPGVYYTWELDARELLDPCAREISTTQWNRAQALAGGASAMRARAVVEGDYDWEGDVPPALAREQAIIYELHLAGFTRHPTAAAQAPGTCAALIEKIPYLQALGVTHVELLPVMAYDEQDVPPGTAALGLRNYWGYSPCAFFAPHPRYAATPERARDELRDLVKALHRAGLGVILDLVLNHTAEGGADGPTLHCKALGACRYYHVTPDGDYANYSGTGNTVNCNDPGTSQLLLACIEYWVREMHVASVLTRGEDGTARADAWLPGALAQSPVLAQTWLIAEPWDAGGLYQLGSFPRARYAEWNGRYRDVVRRCVRGERGLVGELAQCIAGSADLYEAAGRPPAHSINFVTCHDGFTLWDLVSYERKHNEANGEANRDGNDANWSSNCGIEGETAHPKVVALRLRQVRNFTAILLLSQGVPMLLAGDECLRTQRGNNNAYCQDNALGWLDWQLDERRRDMLRFVREMIALRKRHPSLMRTHFLHGAPIGGAGGPPDISWHGTELNAALWDDSTTRVLGFTLPAAAAAERDLHVLLNMSPQALHATLPPRAAGRWHLALDTWRAPPEDIYAPAAQPAVTDATVLVHAFSVVVLEGY